MSDSLYRIRYCFLINNIARSEIHQKTTVLPVLEPVLTYQVYLPEDVQAAVALPLLRQLEEEEPLSLATERPPLPASCPAALP